MSIRASFAKAIGRPAVAAGLIALSVAGATPAGSQTTPTTPAAPLASSADADVQALRERAAAYWAARLAGDPKAQWELLEPRGRGRLTMQEYSADRGAIRIVAYQVEDATVTGFFAVVKVRLMFQPILPSARRVGVQTTIAEDRWVRVQGVWYRKLEEEEPGQPQGRES